MAKSMTTRKVSQSDAVGTIANTAVASAIDNITPTVSAIPVTEVSSNTKKTTTTSQSAKKKYNPDDGIMCRSITVGGLWLDGVKSGNVYRWVEYGDETEVEYRDLVAMIRSRSNYIYAPTFIIEDEEFVSEFPQLKKFYDEQYSIADLRGVLNLPVNSMIETIKTLPPGAASSLKNIASTAIVNGTLDSVKKIKALDEYFGTELNLLASLFQ